ncbi:MAG: hypothetical protein HGA33_00555 [Candidatus Moranbacteria bacterium]|nr:hypothetical protein [Candidatus Moranbacteria bacterium]
MKTNERFWFFEGGQDLEMRTIDAHLEKLGIMRSNKNLAWGAKASDYREEIARAVADGYIPVLIELVIDIDLPEGAIDINHHDTRSAEPASILQVLALLSIEPIRHDLLVAANDAGFLHGLLRFGATPAEIAEIRSGERQIQAITAEQEEQAISALRDMRIKEINGVALGIVDNLPHSRFAPVSDRAFAGGQVDCLVSVYRGEEGSHEIQFEWYPELVRALAEKYPDSWSGGQYWSSYADPDEVILFILSWFKEHGAPEGVAQPSPRQ